MATEDCKLIQSPICCFRINIYVDDTEVAEGRLKRNFDLLVVREDGD